jgi:predicted Zn-dependent protease
LALQNKVARAIADQIRINLNPQEQAALKKVTVVDPEAYESYLKGRYFWNKRTADGLSKAIEYFNEAIERKPDYAEAYAGLADSYALAGDLKYGLLAPREAYPKQRNREVNQHHMLCVPGQKHGSDVEWIYAHRSPTAAVTTATLAICT